MKSIKLNIKVQESNNDSIDVNAHEFKYFVKRSDLAEIRLRKVSFMTDLYGMGTISDRDMVWSCYIVLPSVWILLIKSI